MAFLDNSGDIILDAVLTDTGRMRLAKGDGTFSISQFALGDDEIDYSLYNKTHASGTAYYDLEILQTPVLEAFTNNVSSLNSRLITISDTNVMYMPVMKINELGGPARHDIGAYVVLVDGDTEDSEGTSGNYIFGFNGAANNNNYIRLDQGIDNVNISPSSQISPQLRETSYMVQIDNRFASITDASNTSIKVARLIDDDNIATYVFSETDDASTMVTDNGVTTGDNQVIAGARGTILQFSFQASTELNTSIQLFTDLGSTEVASSGPMSLQAASYYIDTNVSVLGLTTGYRIDIPVRFLKNQS